MYFSIADDKPTLSDLQCMPIACEDGEKPFRLMDHLKLHWKELAIALKFPSHSIGAIEDSKDPVYQLLSDWLKGANMEEDTRPITWRTLIEALRMAKIHGEADTLEKNFALTEKSAVVASQTGMYMVITDCAQLLFMNLLVCRKAQAF